MSGARRAKRPDSGLAGKAGAVLGAVLFLLTLGLELGWPAVQSVPAAVREENPAVSPGAGTGSGRGKSRLSLRAREIRYSEKTKVFLARGEVLIRLENLTITADEAEVDTERNIARLRGAVHLVRTKKGKPEEETRLEAAELEVQTKDKDFVARGGVVIVQKERRFVAREAEYRDAEGTLALKGEVRITAEDESLLAQEAVLFAETDEFTAEGVEAELLVD